MEEERAGFLRIDGWAGRRHIRVTVVGRTRTKYRIRLEESALLPGGRQMEAGAVTLVPQYAVVFEEDAER